MANKRASPGQVFALVEELKLFTDEITPVIESERMDARTARALLHLLREARKHLARDGTPCDPPPFPDPPADWVRPWVARHPYN